MAQNSPITVGDVLVKPGTRANVNIPVADLYTSTSLHMPVHVICGRRAGPTIFVSAAVHGDELNGVEIIRRLLGLKSLKSIRGTLLAVPVVNVHGFLNQSRYLPDRRDLNRSFPGKATGSIAARLANIFLKQVVLKAQFGIDLHTGALDRSNLPQMRANVTDPEILKIAESFGAPVVLNGAMRPGSLRACAAERGIPVVVYEAGEALRFDEVSIRAGLRGILRVMRSIGMLPAKANRRPANSVLASSSSWVRAPESGIVTSKAALGARVKAGQPLALITDPLGEHSEAVISPMAGIIIGCSNLPLAHEGDALFHIASFDSVKKAEDAVGEFSTIHDPTLGRSIEPGLLET